MWKWIYKTFIWPFTKEGLEYQRKMMIEQHCPHKEWTCDTQIRLIKCNKCGKKAWITEYKDLFKK